MSVKHLSGRVSAHGEAMAGVRWTPTALVKMSAARGAPPCERRCEWGRTAGCRCPAVRVPELRAQGRRLRAAPSTAIQISSKGSEMNAAGVKVVDRSR